MSPRGVAVIVLLSVLSACSADDVAPAAERAASPAHPRGSRAALERRPAQILRGEAECVRDEDCELLPEITCCEECVPVPPFEPVPRSTIDDLLLETEERCVRDPRPCSAFPRCTPLPDGCAAHAVCDGGRCGLVAVGCEWPNI